MPRLNTSSSVVKSRRFPPRAAMPYLGLALLLSVILLPLLLEQWTPWSWRNAAVHTTIEETCAMAGLAIIVILVGASRSQLDGRTALASAAIVVTAILDSIHAPTPVGQAFVFVKGLGVTVAGVLFFAAWIPAVRSLAAGRRSLMVGAALATTTLAATAVAFPAILPTMVVGITSTRLAVWMNVAGGLLLLAAAPNFVMAYQRTRESRFYLFACLAVLVGISGVAMRLTTIWDDGWWCLHLMRMAIYLAGLAYVLRRFSAMLSPANSRDVQRRHQFFAPMVLIMLTMGIGMTLFETLKDLTARNMVKWQSQAINIAFCSLLASGMAWSLLRKWRQIASLLVNETDEKSQVSEALRRANEGLQRDITARKRIEEERANTIGRQQGISLLQQSLLAPAPLEDKLKAITDGIVRLFAADFCRIWLIGPGDLCERDCMHAEVHEGPHVCHHREKCLHLLASSRRYTHTDGKEHRRVPLGCYNIGRLASDGEHKFLTNDVANAPGIHNYQWARELELVAFAGYQLRVPDGETMGVLALFAKHPISAEEDAMLDGLSNSVAFVLQQAAAEEAVRQSTLAAEAANIAKSQFLANMSHDIRTPMTAILGYAELSMDPSASAGDRHNYLSVIHRNGRQLLELVNDILDLSKIEAGKVSMEVRPVAVTSVLADVASVVRVRARQHGIALSVEYTSPMPATVRTDGSHLRQILMNLVGNAVKFTERGGVRIVASLQDQWRGERSAIQVQVIDTGIGIPVEKMAQLFQPFVQADNSISRKYGGTGLGLVISRRMAELLGGELTAQSQPGQGSVFTLIFPTGSLKGVKMLNDPAEAVQAERERVEHVALAPKLLSGLRILLAEDGVDNQRLITTILHKAGAEVRLAENGRIALETVREAGAEGYHVILMDMQMPEMDGYQATQALRQGGYSGPILALTAHAMSGDRAKCIAAGCDDHLAKPIDRACLIATIARFAGRLAEGEGAGKAIASQCRQNDLPARYGGEEFAIIVPDETASGAALLAERCRQSVADVRVRVGEGTTQITASLGVADAAQAASSEGMIQQADKALYDAKTNGRNRVISTSDQASPAANP